MSSPTGLARHVEGKPAVVVQNQPGAGSVIAMNNYANRVARDGTTVLIGTGQLLVRLLLGLDGARREDRRFPGAGRDPDGAHHLRVAADRVQIEQGPAQPAEPLILGVPEVISTIDAVLGLTVLKANFRSITGYPGKADVRLALLRNEINLDSQATPIFEQSVRPTVKDGKAIPLFAQGFMDGDNLTRDPAAPDVPSVGEAYRDDSWRRAVGTGVGILQGDRARHRQRRQDHDDPQRRPAGSARRPQARRSRR